MAGKKFYAVKKGKITGVFESWEACKNSVEGYPGAEYKGFSDRAQANLYLGISEDESRGPSGTAFAAATGDDMADCKLPPEGQLLAYVDGSFEESIGKYSFGNVFILPDGRIFTAYGNGDEEKSLQHHNVTGEMLGAMYAVLTAMRSGYKSVEICYDYQGIEKWVTGEWKSKTELTQKYTQSMRAWRRSIDIVFTKVSAHTNVTYNELADQMAKKGLTEGQGVPPIKTVEELERYGVDKTE